MIIQYLLSATILLLISVGIYKNINLQLENSNFNELSFRLITQKVLKNTTDTESQFYTNRLNKRQFTIEL